MKVKNFHSLFLTYFCGESGEIFNFTAFHGFPKKRNPTKPCTSVHGFEPLTSCMSTTSYSTAPSFTLFFNISSEFKLDFKKGWKTNAANFGKKCGEFCCEFL